jgi:hypothetical protein
MFGIFTAHLLFVLFHPLFTCRIFDLPALLLLPALAFVVKQLARIVHSYALVAA